MGRGNWEDSGTRFGDKMIQTAAILPSPPPLSCLSHCSWGFKQKSDKPFHTISSDHTVWTDANALDDSKNVGAPAAEEKKSVDLGVGSGLISNDFYLV